MTVPTGEERYADLIRAYWLARGYLVEPYVTTQPIKARAKGGNQPNANTNYQAVRSNLVNGLPHADSKVDVVKVNYTVVGDDAFLLKGKPTTR